MFAFNLNGQNMKRQGYLVLRIFLYAIIFLVALTIFASSYIYINRDKLIASFLIELKNQVGLDMRYSKLNLNPKDFFPFAAFTFNDFELKYTCKDGIENRLQAKKVNLTINTLDLIRGKYNIRNCIIETGQCIVNLDCINSLIKEYSSQNQSAEKTATNISIDKFQLKDYNLYLNNKLELKIINSLILIKINGNMFSSINCDIENIVYDGTVLVRDQIRVESKISGNESTFDINSLIVGYKSIEMDFDGTYSKNSGDVFLNFSSNTFDIIDLSDYFSSKDFIKISNGKTKLSGFCAYNMKSNIFKSIDFSHSTKAKIKYEKNTINISELSGNTKLTNNLKNHFSEINTLKLSVDKTSADLKIKIKGIYNPVLLVEGQININQSKVCYSDKSISVRADGSFKTLLSFCNKKQSSNGNVIIHQIRGDVKYDIGMIDGIDMFRNIEGSASLGKHLQINATASFDNKPMEITVLQTDLVKLINGEIPISPKINIKAEYLDIDYLLEVSDEIIGQNSSKSENQYSIKLNSNNLRFFNYNFSKVNATIYYKNDFFEIQSFRGNGFDGQIGGILKNIGDTYYIETDFEKINISELFKHYNNFNQSLVTSRNINGNLSGKAFLNFEIDTNGDIKTPSIKLDSDILIQNGKLIGMNKIKKLSKWLKLNEVKSIDFETIQNKIEIKDQNLKIPKMDILSNVINLQLSGEHKFNNTYSYWMRINLSKIIAQRLLSLNYYDDQVNTSEGAINLYLKLNGNSEDYEIKMDKKGSFEKIKGNFESEGIMFKDLLLQEFKQIGKKDSLPKTNTGDTANKRNPTFTIEWDEYDSLNIENNFSNDF